MEASVCVATKVDRFQTMAEIFNEAEKTMYKRKTLNARETRQRLYQIPETDFAGAHPGNRGPHGKSADSRRGVRAGFKT